MDLTYPHRELLLELQSSAACIHMSIPPSRLSVGPIVPCPHIPGTPSRLLSSSASNTPRDALLTMTIQLAICPRSVTFTLSPEIILQRSAGPPPNCGWQELLAPSHPPVLISGLHCLRLPLHMGASEFECSSKTMELKIKIENQR